MKKKNKICYKNPMHIFWVLPVCIIILPFAIVGMAIHGFAISIFFGWCLLTTKKSRNYIYKYNNKYFKGLLVEETR